MNVGENLLQYSKVEVGIGIETMDVPMLPQLT